MTHAGGSVGWGGGLEAGAAYLIRTGGRWLHAIGFFVAVAEVFYVLPGDGSILDSSRRDAQVDLGVISTIF